MKKEDLKLFNNPIEIKDHPTGPGVQRFYKYSNGFGASVVRFKMPIAFGRSYGNYTNDESEWELAVLDCRTNGNGKLTYDTPIANDVIGHLKDNDVNTVLSFISRLNKAGDYRGIRGIIWADFPNN